MITIHIPNNFISERTYAVRTLLTHYCGVAAEIVMREDATAYELCWDQKSIMIADSFFGKIPEGKNYLGPEWLPQRPEACTAIGFEGIIRLYGEEQLEFTKDAIRCSVDLFAGLFFMLTRWEEALPAEKDLHGRFPASAAAIVKAGFILRPVVDEYAALLRSWLKALGFPVPVDRSEYKVVPTCDVDMPLYWQSKPLWKSLGGRLLKHWNVLESVRDFNEYKSVKDNSSKDPFDTFDYLMDLAETKNTRFIFNFIAGGNTTYEGYYTMRDPFIHSLVHSIQERGHQIGLHPSYDTFDDVRRLADEKRSLEESIGMPVHTSRQHFLRFKLPDTFQHLDRVGILEDSTMGYAAEPGFRCGTSKPFRVFDINTREELSLIERPLLVMDVSLRLYKNLDVQQSITLCEQIKAEVKKHHGEFVFLWHNSTLREVDGWNGWNEVLENLLQE